MSRIRVTVPDGFHFGDPAVLVAMDATGLDVLMGGLDQVLQHGVWRLDHHGTVHTFAVDAGASDVELDGDRVQWRLDRATVIEMVAKLHALQAEGRPGHHYVDFRSPADTLVLSLDEYPDGRVGG